MILDSSALIAMLREEPEAPQFRAAAAAASNTRISAATFLEAAIVADSQRNAAASGAFDNYVTRMSVTIEPVTESHARVARQAYRDYGKGSGHPAQLNFGDCFAYALAKEKDEPLLFKGADFGLTDIKSAV